MRAALTPAPTATATESTAAPVVQRRCVCGGSHAGGGQCEECRVKERLGLQPKLIVGPANDPLKHEADRAAEAATAEGPFDLGAAPVATVRRRVVSGGIAGQVAPPSVSCVVGSAGEPLGRAELSFARHCPDFNVLLRAARLTHRRQELLYDDDTKNGCDATAQATWESSIAEDLPGFEINLPS